MTIKPFAALLGALLLAGCTTSTAVIFPIVVAQQNDLAPATFTVVSGRRTMLRRVFMLHADCSLSSYPDMRLTVPPEHGTLTIMRGEFYPSYPPDDQRYACNVKPQAGVAAFYQPDPGYVGSDNLTLLVIRSDGIVRTLNYHLDVK